MINPFKSKKGLGRGLSSLIGDSEKIDDKKIAICKEITKINERVFVGLPNEVLKEFRKDSKNTLGEFVVVIEGNNNQKKSKSLVDLKTEDALKKLLQKFSLTDTVEIVHKMGNIGKKELYKKALELQNEK